MMSTAILMAETVEQPGVRVLSTGKSEETASFAKSFDEKIGTNTEVSSGRSPGELADDGKRLNTERAGSNATIPVPVGAKGQTAADLTARENWKGEVAEKMVAPQLGSPARSFNNSVVEGVQTAEAEMPEKEVATQPAQGPKLDPKDSLDEDSLELASAATAGASVEEQTQIVGDSGIAAQKVNDGAAEEVQNSGPAKKAIKTQDTPATTKPVHKAANTGVGTSVIGVKVNAGPPNQATVLAASQVTTTNSIPLNISPRTPENGGEVAIFSAGKASAGIAGLPAQSSSFEQVAHGAKEVVGESQTGVSSAASATDGQLAAPKPGAEDSKPVPVAAVPSADVEGKTQSLGSALLHAVSADSGSALGTSLGATPFVSMPGDGGAAKLPAAGTTAHGTNLQASSGGAEGYSAVPTAGMERMPKTLVATPTALEIGIQNGTHGWLKVRAEMTDGGVVNASVSTASSSGQEMLHRELPALTAYLQQEKVAVNTVVIHTPTAANAEFRGSGPETNGGGSYQAQQSSDEKGQQQQNIGKMGSDRVDETTDQQSWDGTGEDATLSPVTYAGGGSWLSVRA
jgi:hypothetical protein